MPKLVEVPESERRTGTAVGTGPAAIVTPTAPEKVLVGSRKGVGGVIEAFPSTLTPIFLPTSDFGHESHQTS